jgi:hypothetical protein
MSPLSYSSELRFEVHYSYKYKIVSDLRMTMIWRRTISWIIYAEYWNVFYVFSSVFWGELKWICKGLWIKHAKGKKILNQNITKSESIIFAFWTLIQLFPILIRNKERREGWGPWTKQFGKAWLRVYFKRSTPYPQGKFSAGERGNPTKSHALKWQKLKLFHRKKLKKMKLSHLRLEPRAYHIQWSCFAFWAIL